MKYLETKYERDSAKITLLITVILVLLLFVVGRPYMDPPEEFGVAVNFGSSNIGSGKIQPKVKNTIDKVTPPESSQSQASTPSETSNVTDNIVTNDLSEEVLKIDKLKAEEKKQRKLEEERIANEILEKQLARKRE